MVPLTPSELRGRLDVVEVVQADDVNHRAHHPRVVLEDSRLRAQSGASRSQARCQRAWEGPALIMPGWFYGLDPALLSLDLNFLIYKIEHWRLWLP